MTLVDLTGKGPDGTTNRSSDDEKRERGGQLKDPDSITDTESTGRKRAAKLFPIQTGMACEWRRLKLAGGGVVPIVGCIGGVATDRHHGPNKSTLANFIGNVHRICATCHNRWHSVNDQYYSGERPPGIEYLPLSEYTVYEHLPFLYAEDTDLAKAEVAWLESNAEDVFRELMAEETDKLKALTR